MLAIRSHCHNGDIHLSQEGIPADSDVIVLFLNTANEALSGLTAEQRASLIMQSQTGFAQSVLLDPAEDCWDTI